MDKEKILKKARNENKDEREEHILIKSFKIGWYGVLLMLVVLYALQLYFKEPNSTELNLILMAHLTTATYYQYKKFDNKKYLIAVLILIGGIVMGFAALLSQYGVY